MKGGEKMGWWRWTTPLMVAALLSAWQFVPSQTDKVALGRTLYLRHCAACHGERGKGDGQLTKVIVPPVPDLTEGVFKLRSTPSGTLPTDDDLRRVIGEGIPATPMFGVKGLLSEEELDALVAFTKSLVPKFRTEGSGKPIAINPMPPSPELLALGRQVYAKFQCGACHGLQGDGNGPLAKTLRDSKGRPVRVLSLRDARNYKNGYTPADIYRTLMTGMDGTPMPSFAGAMSEREAWALAHFVHSLIVNNPPPRREGTAIKVAFASTTTNSQGDSYQDASSLWLPLQSTWGRTGKPEALQVQATLMGRQLLLRLVWDDPTPNEGAPRPDGVAVQCPEDLMKPLPSLFWGDPQAPVRVWRWMAGRGGEVGRATGVGTMRRQSTPFEANGQWRQGQWSVVMKIPLPDGVQRLPMAFSVWDGGSGDEGERRMMTGWHWLIVEPR
jgi:DMSO reductase family type II enzyme heme b subunit